MKLKNNTILITGGTSGLGYEFARKLLSMGNTVIVTGRDQQKLDKVKEELPMVHTFHSDVSDAWAIIELHEKLMLQFPELNMLINNAGEMRKIILHNSSVSLHDITREIEINLMGPVRMIQQFIPDLMKQRIALIVNITSGLALIPFPISPIYGATKAGLRSYTKSLRVQLKNTAVKVVEVIAPAASTPLNDTFMGIEGFDPKMMMDPVKLIDEVIKGLESDKAEIYPGMAKVIRLMSRLAPAFLLKQMSKVGAGLMQGD